MTAPRLRAGVVISVLTRQDVVVMDPERFLAAARRAYRTDHPGADADAEVADVDDAVAALLDRYGSVASEHPDVAAGATARQAVTGGFGFQPGDRVGDRPDGLSPAGTMSVTVLGERPLQDYGCFLPPEDEVFAGPLRRSDAGGDDQPS